MNLIQRQQHLLPQIESGLQFFLDSFDFNHSLPLKHMIRYQMGWEDQGSKGKRIRPFLVLLISSALGGEVEVSMPAALSVEFLHNFTLIHDDIEDQSPLRHNRPTLWKQWGVAQAINAGDALFSIAQLCMLDLQSTCSSSIALKAAGLLNQTCLHLTRGQYLDMSFETEDNVAPQIYLEMIAGKTGALLGLCAVLGGLTAAQDDEKIRILHDFGTALGMAFQIRDDILGIWGNPEKTGKSVSSDLQTKKKTFPILIGLVQSQPFQNLWQMNDVDEAQIEQMAELLEECGARKFAQQKAEEYTKQAFDALEILFPSPADKNPHAETLFELCTELLKREI